ncbi:hypothetical protein HPP92_011404 [Vanilla planifolia]|uniref:Beta-hexosaminidase eukaryotic type N-terminal domain-containing protein n=1 Tax=Vanilla planifolia TaxID=51239 RepID=A0A835R0S3_VANPL|nr:hypothetical protein HPP92_011404 [Vanilla planifolia]
MSLREMSGIGAAVVAGVLVGFSLIVDGLNLWPMPASVSYGSRTLYFSNDLQLRTDGSNYSDASGILKDGFSRMIDVIQTTHVVDGNVPSSGALHGLHVRIFSLDDELNFGTDETYKLFIPESGEDTYAYIEAQTVYGALHAFETFSQLCIFNFDTRIYEIHSAPWKIVDGPRFPLSWTSDRHVQAFFAITNNKESHRLHELYKAECATLAYCRQRIIPHTDTLIS